MGYYSDYEVIIRGLSDGKEEKFIEDLQAFCPDLVQGLEYEAQDIRKAMDEGKTDLITLYFNAKWYDCGDEIEDISFKYPELEFTIYATGEDGEMWVVYGCNGVVESYPAEVKYPEPTVFKKKEDKKDGSSN